MLLLEACQMNNALSLIENITKFFDDQFAMRDVTIYATHWVAIVCIILDEHKRAIILDSSRVYFKCTSFFITKDQTPKEQECRTEAHASRKGI